MARNRSRKKTKADYIGFDKNRSDHKLKLKKFFETTRFEGSVDEGLIQVDRMTKKQQTHKPIKIEPRSENQKRYIEMLNDPSKHIIFGIGPAGSGKTMMATLYAIQQLKERNIDKIVITRPAVSVDEQHGFVPGTLDEKMLPWTMPILDVCNEHFSMREVKDMIDDKVIAIEPLAYMRGRTFKNSVILADEVQNCTIDQVKMLLTRIGENSKLVVTGDITQHDRGFEKNGLHDIITKLQNKPNIMNNGFGILEFDNIDIQRHQIIGHVLSLYGDC